LRDCMRVGIELPTGSLTVCQGFQADRRPHRPSMAAQSRPSCNPARDCISRPPAHATGRVASHCGIPLTVCPGFQADRRPHRPSILLVWRYCKQVPLMLTNDAYPKWQNGGYSSDRQAFVWDSRKGTQKSTLICPGFQADRRPHRPSILLVWRYCKQVPLMLTRQGYPVGSSIPTLMQSRKRLHITSACTRHRQSRITLWHTDQVFCSYGDTANKCR
jgi:hypothetical protein